MSETEQQTRRLDQLSVDLDSEGHFATLIMFKEKKVFSHVTLEEETTLIGRNPDCTITLGADTEASRHHAQVRLSTNINGLHQYWLSDLGSTNGTHLNGKRLAPHQETLLRDGDKFIIGQHLFKFALLDQSNEKFLTGNLTQVSLFDLIQIIENNRLTCICIVRGQNEIGKLYFNLGQIVGCEISETQGLEAFRKLVEIQEGFFEVEKHDQEFPVTLEATSNMNLVLDTLRELDEEHAELLNQETDEQAIPNEMFDTASTGLPENEAMRETHLSESVPVLGIDLEVAQEEPITQRVIPASSLMPTIRASALPPPDSEPTNS